MIKHSKTKSIAILFLLFLVQLVFFSSFSTAQEPTASKAAAAETPVELAPITIETLVGEIEEHIKLQDEFASFIEASRSEEFLVAYTQITESLTEKIESLEEEAREKLVFSAEELKELEAPITEVRKSMLELSAELEPYAAKCAAFLKRFNEAKQRWSKARNSFIDNRESRDLVARIDVGLDLMKTNIKKAENELDKLVLIQARLAANSSDIRKVKESVAFARMRFEGALFEREDSPMYTLSYWSSLFNVSPLQRFKTLIERFDGASKYFVKNSNKALIFCFLTIIVSLVVRNIRKSDLAKRSFKTLHDNPIILSTVTSLVFARFIYYDAPPEALKLIAFLMVLPVTLFLIDILGRRYSDVIIGIAVVYIFGEVRILLREDIYSNQFLLLIQMLFSIYLARRFVQDCDCVGKREEEQDLPKSLLVLGRVGRFFQVLFSVAAVLLIAGFYRLVLFLEEPLLHSIYTSLGLFVLYRLATGFFTYLIYSDLLKPIRSISKNQDNLDKFTKLFCLIIVCIIWFFELLEPFQVRDAVFTSIYSFFAWGVQFGSLNIQVGGVFLAVFFLTMGGRISSAIRYVLEADVYSRKELNESTRNTIDTGLHFLILIFAVLAAIGSLGIGLKNLAIVAGALSVGIGFGLQNIVNNFVSGMILLFERPIKVGDLVESGTMLGNVARIGIRSSTIRTLDSAEIIIPNSTLVTENVVNWTHSNRRARISVSFGVAYGTDVNEVMELLTNLLKSESYVLDYPAPDVLFRAFGDSSLNFEARGWIRNVQDRPQIQSQLAVAVHDALKEAGIKIPFPQRDLHIVSDVRS